MNVISRSVMVAGLRREQIARIREGLESCSGGQVALSSASRVREILSCIEDVRSQRHNLIGVLLPGAARVGDLLSDCCNVVVALRGYGGYEGPIVLLGGVREHNAIIRHSAGHSIFEIEDFDGLTSHTIQAALGLVPSAAEQEAALRRRFPTS